MQLFVEDAAVPLQFTRRVTARSKMMAYDHTSTADPKHSIVYKPGQVATRYHNQETVLVTVYHCWTATTHKIRSITPTNSTLTLLQAPHVDIARCDAKSGHRFYIENAVEHLTTPGR